MELKFATINVIVKQMFEDSRIKFFKPDLDYMTNMEMRVFTELMEEGKISVFKTSTCKTCGKSIIYFKKYCSEGCCPVINEKREEDDEEYW